MIIRGRGLHGVTHIALHDRRPGVHAIGPVKRNSRDFVADLIENMLIAQNRSPRARLIATMTVAASCFGSAAGARTFWPRQIIDGFRPRLQPSSPAPEYFGHPIRLDPELRHCHAAVYGFAVFGNQAIAHEESTHAIDHHA